MTDTKKLSPLAETVFIGEIVKQSNFADIAADKLVMQSESDSDEIWGAIQSILVAAANVSKILWSPNKKYKARGNYLRELLGIDDDNVLSNRTLRNHLEHYDERIEKWFDTNSSAAYFDAKIDPFEKTAMSLPQFFHRTYNPITREITFRHESFDLAAILDALAKIREKSGAFALIK